MVSAEFPPLPSSGIGIGVWVLALFGTGGGLWAMVQSLLPLVTNRTGRKNEIAHQRAVTEKVKVDTDIAHLDREKWIQEIADKHYERLDTEFEEYRAWARALRRAAEKMIDVFEPWVSRSRPASDEDSTVITVHAAEYLMGRDSIHDVREHLR